MNLRNCVAAASLAGAAVTAVATPALAVGTGGVELTPLSGGKQMSSFHVHLAPGERSTQHLQLRNTGSSTVQFSLYAADVVKSKSGDFVVEGPGTAPWIALKPQTISLAGGQSREMSFAVRRTATQRGPVAYGAVVMSITDKMVVTRAAAMVYLARPGSDPVKKALLPILIAALVPAVGFGAHVWVRRRGKAAPDS